MNLTFVNAGKIGGRERRLLQIDDARLIYRNFAGAPSKFNANGVREFAVIIDSQEQADALVNDLNEFGVGWNVKVREARDEGDEPFMFLKVKVKFNGRGPAIYLRSGDSKPVELTEETVGCLDNCDMMYVRLDVRPFDDIVNGKPFRSAYLHSMEVIQETNRFAREYAEQEYPN